MRLPVIALLLVLLAACTEPVSRDDTSGILLMGDSMMAIHKLTNRDVAGDLERDLGREVTDRSVSGARYFYILPISGAAGMRITSQYRPGKWDWIVLNGGGNDIFFGCGCGKCKRMLTRLVAPDGTKGAIPQFVARLRKTGARVIYVGYLRTPGVTSPIEGCVDKGDIMDARLTRMAARDDGVWFLPMSDVVPYGDTSYHAVDLVHPSKKGSAAIAARIAALIRQVEGAQK